MKTLIEFAKANNLQVVEIEYKHQGVKMKRKGFDLIDPETRDIFASFEPKVYSNGDRWFLRHGTHREDKDFCKKISAGYLSKLCWDEYPVRLK